MLKWPFDRSGFGSSLHFSENTARVVLNALSISSRHRRDGQPCLIAPHAISLVPRRSPQYLFGASDGGEPAVFAGSGVCLD